ncbi:hypothetical protein BaRGS_00030501 [Batillaria attramentaria]|uniref:Uncharacterized protein n=1 Tax=Batillaria attramentaria TaxID=370345 RepID=A0ABD0JUN1_9CAEN
MANSQSPMRREESIDARTCNDRTDHRCCVITFDGQRATTNEVKQLQAFAVTGCAFRVKTAFDSNKLAGRKISNSASFDRVHRKGFYF